MGVSLGHSRDLMTIAQVSYNVTASVQPRLKLCWFCHFTGCLRSLILPGGFGLSLLHYLWQATCQSRPALGPTKQLTGALYKINTLTFTNICQTFSKTRMWANAQPDGRPAEHSAGGALCSRLQSLADAHYRPILDCRAVTMPRHESR